jgi:hypothetical protein
MGRLVTMGEAAAPPACAPLSLWACGELSRAEEGLGVRVFVLSFPLGAAPELFDALARGSRLNVYIPRSRQIAKLSIP